MSGIPPKKKLKSSPVGAARPEDIALKPKPSIHAIKRPTPGSIPGASTVPVLSKKPRIDFSSGGSALGKPGFPGSSPPKPQIDTTWLDFCKSTPVEIDTFSEQLTAAFQDGKVNKAARLITAVFRLFIEKKIDEKKFFIEYHLLTTCSVTIKEHGEKLTNLYLHKCFLNILCWMKSLSIDRQELLAALVICLAEKQQTLDQYYLTIFLHDALGDRIWVDKAITNRLLSILLKPFGTQYPSKEQYSAAAIELPYPESVASPEAVNKFEEKEPGQLNGLMLEYMKKCWAADPPNRNVLRTMSMLAGIPEVRSMASKRMDSWSANIKLQRHALELLLFVGCNFGSAASSEHDRETLSALLKMRNLKSKQTMSVFVVTLREIVTKDENNLRVAINMILNNEFGPPTLRSPVNALLLQTLFGFDNVKATRVFAQELSASVILKEELAKHARLWTRELFRSSLRSDFNYPLFAEAYLNHILEEERRSELGIEEHVVYRSATEVITMLPLVSITQQVKEAANLRRNNQPISPELLNVLNKMEKDLSAYYDVVLKWLQYAKQLFMEAKEYCTAYYRYLFLEKSEYYTMMDQGPSEPEFGQAAKIFGEFCFTDRHMRLIVGERYNSLSQEDTIQLLYDLVNRSIVHRFGTDPRTILQFTGEQPASALVQRVLDVCLFRPNFGYDGELIPMFVRSIYWKSWVIIIIWACCEKPLDALSSIYESFPMFRFLIHCILTKQFTFPVAFEGLSEEETQTQEDGFLETEVEALIKQENIFERKHNREADVTEQTSQLVQTCLLAQNCVRRPPDMFLQEVRALSSECQLVSALCECRKPDLLRILIDNYGAPKAMPAIQDLLLTNPSAIDGLDTMVLCEFLIYHMQTDPRHRQIGDEKIQVITTKLRSCLDTDVTPLLFFLKRLTSLQASDRLVTHKSLGYLFGQNPETEPYLKFSRLETVGCFEKSKSEIGVAVAGALLYENDPVRSEAATALITKTLSKENMHQIAVAVSPLSARSDLAILKTLVKFFERYNAMCQEYPDEWKELEGATRYRVCSLNKEFNMGSTSVHSILNLLCKCNEKSAERETLIQIWFPENGICPTVTEDGKPVEVLPESLRSSMLCAEDDRITRIALKGVDGATAVKLLSTFGLTVYSATQLMAIVDKMSLSEIGETAALTLQPFVIAYRHRGASGGDSFQKKLSEWLDSKMETKDDTVTDLVPPPKLEPMVFVADKLPNKQEVSQLLKEITVQDSPHLFICPISLVRSALGNKDIALVAVDHFEGQLKFFLANPDAFHEIMMIISNSADLYPEVKSKVTSLAIRLLKSAAVRPALEGYLRKFSPPQTTNVVDEVDNKNLHRILGLLSRVAHGKEELDEETQTNFFLQVFGGKLVGEGFIAQIPQRYSPETVIYILQKLLVGFESAMNPTLVCEFVASSCCSELTSLNQKFRLSVLARYLTEMIRREPSNLGKTVDVVDRLITAYGFDVLIPICAELVSIDRSDLERSIRAAAVLLTEDLLVKFPCIEISPICTEVTLTGTRWRVDQGDKYCTTVIYNMFECDDEEEANQAIYSLQQLAKFSPALVVREFGMMVNQLSTLLSKDSRDLKSEVRRLTLSVIRQIAVDLMPKLQTEDLKHVDTAIALLLAIHDKHAKGKEDATEMRLTEMIIALVMSYLEHHLENAREMLEENAKSLEACCALHSLNPASIALLQQIESLSLA